LLSTAACSSSSDGPDKETDDPPSEGEYAKGIADPCANPLSTPYLNDELCIDPPPPDVGDQIHYGPALGADYDDPDAIAPFLIPPYANDYVKCMFTEMANEEEVFSNEYHTRARSGTHHVIMWTSVTDDAEREPKGSFVEGSCRALKGHVFFPGTQAGLGKSGARLDVPVDGKQAEENVGYARRIAPKAHVAIETHYVNLSEDPMLAEVWMNVIYMPKDELQVVTDPIFLIGGLNANVGINQRQITGTDFVKPPQTKEGEIRIMGFAAHSHAHTKRVTAWINRAGSAEREYVYETYDWSEPLMPQFDTAHTYPAMQGMGSGKEGAHNGILKMGKDDTFGWECEVENNDSTTPLTFGDGAYSKEMCNIFGFYAPGTGYGNWAGFGKVY
jgi:hypothetical protein